MYVERMNIGYIISLDEPIRKQKRDDAFPFIVLTFACYLLTIRDGKIHTKLTATDQGTLTVALPGEIFPMPQNLWNDATAANQTVANKVTLTVTLTPAAAGNYRTRLSPAVCLDQAS